MPYPAIFMDETAVMDIATPLLAGVVAVLATSTGGPVAHNYITWGEVVHDWCQDDCGQAVLSIGSTYPSNDFPSPYVGSINCDPVLLAVNMSLEIIRCVPVPDENGNPPLDSALTAATSTMLSDAHVSRETVRCLLNGYREAQPQLIQNYYIGTSTPVGPSGGCGGSRLEFIVSWQTGCRCT